MKCPPALGGRVRSWIWEVGLFLVVPLAFYRGFAEPFSTPKFFLTKFLIITALAIWGLGRIWTAPPRRFQFNLALPLLEFSIAIVISCLDSPAPRFSLMEVEYALCGPAWLLLLASSERGQETTHRIAALTGIASALVAGIILLQRLGFDPVVLGGYQVEWGSMVARMRLYSTLGNPNFVAGYMVGTIFAALALAGASKSIWARGVWSCVALMMLAAIIETASRGAWLGLAVGLVAATITVLPNNSKQHHAVIAGTVSKTFVAPAICWPLAMMTLSLGERLATQFQGRIYLWRFSWPIFWQHPIVGSGWGAYQLLYLELQGRFLSAHPEYAGFWTNNRLLHNDPLQLLLEAGLAGFTTFLWILWRYGREARRVRSQFAGGWPRLMIAASVGGVTAILVDSLFNYQFAIPPTYILLFTLLAIPSMLHDEESEKESVVRPTVALPARHHPWQVALKLAGSVAIVVAAAALLWQQTGVLASEHLYQTASDLENHNDLANAEAGFRRSVELNDQNGRAHFGLSRVLASRSRFSEALAELERAEQTYADSHQEVLRGIILERMGRNSEALAAYRRAVWLDPTLASTQQDLERLNQSRSLQAQ